MVQKTDKFTDQRLFSSRNATTSSQKHFSFPIRKMALGDLPDELGSIMDSPVSPVEPNEARKTSDLTKLAGNKRQQPESSSTPAPNGSCHLVYVRRKLETDHGKTNAASNENTSCSPGVKKSLDTTEAQPEQTGNPKEDHSKNIDEVPSHVDEPQIEILNYWTERFNVLQDHLQYLDKSGSKDYAEKFRNYSVEELNKYAVELEKRAIRLSLEEALQGKRVKDLNLMGKFSL
ncbi:hypothetical protein KSP39_PZI013206 [Platanthera zijinensis]|uniref:Uncharacterized protein n=1 Tax=Platanthera zijinensis TaxID=2320716 RepID=A0AAP0BE00_9ASPA